MTKTDAEREASRKETNRRYYLKNVEYHKQYAEEHKERIAANHEQWHKDNPGYATMYAKHYAEEHKEEICRWRRLPETLAYRAAYDKQYNRENPKEPRDYVTPAGQCSQLNAWFEGSERHHVDPETIIHIPAEMHRSIKHNIQTGAGMAGINSLAFAFLNGQRELSAQMSISDF